MLGVKASAVDARCALARPYVVGVRFSGGPRPSRNEACLFSVRYAKMETPLIFSCRGTPIVATYRLFSSSSGGGGSSTTGYSGGFNYSGSSSNTTVFPGSSSIPQGLELQRGHHLQSSVGLHSPIATACGRSFDPQVYYEVLQACCDPQWMSAIQRELRMDSEYAEYLRANGGVASEVRAITESVHHDDDLMMKLKDRLKTDKGISLALCAIQDSYMRIRRKRDQHETQVAADGGLDPYATMKDRQRGGFGAQQPKFQ